MSIELDLMDETTHSYFTKSLYWCEINITTHALRYYAFVLYRFVMVTCLDILFSYTITVEDNSINCILVQLVNYNVKRKFNVLLQLQYCKTVLIFPLLFVKSVVFWLMGVHFLCVVFRFWHASYVCVCEFNETYITIITFNIILFRNKMSDVVIYDLIFVISKNKLNIPKL